MGQTRPPQVDPEALQKRSVDDLDSGHGHRGSDGRSVCANIDRRSIADDGAAVRQVLGRIAESRDGERSSF